MVFVSIEFDVMVDVEFADDDDVGDDKVGDDDVVAIIDKIVFNGEPDACACAWPTDAFDAIGFSAGATATVVAPDDAVPAN